MTPGTKVVCRDNSNYHNLTHGKTYEVVDYLPPGRVDWYTWPAYVGVVDDCGDRTYAHAHRFVEVGKATTPERK